MFTAGSCLSACPTCSPLSVSPANTSATDAAAQLGTLPNGLPRMLSLKCARTTVRDSLITRGNCRAGHALCQATHSKGAVSCRQQQERYAACMQTEEIALLPAPRVRGASRAAAAATALLGPH
jgi:hypothetical protein